jgi:hypothetical protein
MTTLTPDQKRMHDLNIARLQRQQIFGNECSKPAAAPKGATRPEDYKGKPLSASLLDSVVATTETPPQSRDGKLTLKRIL